MKKVRLSGLRVLIFAIPAAVSGADLQKAQNTTAVNAAGSFTVISGSDADGIPDADDRIIWNSAFTTGAGINPRTVGVLSALGGDTAVAGLQVTNVAGTVNIANTAVGVQNPNSANTLSIGAGGIDMATATQALYLEPKIAITASQTWNVGNANTAASSSGFNNGEDLAFRAMTAASATTANTAFTLGGNTVTTSGVGTINISSGYAVSGGTMNIGNSLFIFSGGDTRAATVAADVNLNVAAGATLHFQSNSGIITSSAAIGLNGGTLKLVSNNAANQVTVNGTTTVNAASTLLVGNNVGAGSVAATNGVLFNSNLAGSAALAVTNNASTASVLVMGGNNSAYTGTLTFGGTAGRVSRLTTANSGSAAATWNVGTGQTLQLHGVAVNLGTLAGAGAVTTSLAGASTATVGAGTFTGILSNGTGTLALTKNTAGTLTLTGANTYTGGTQVSQGTLITTPLQTGSTTVSVADGATFGVSLQTVGTTFATTTLNAGTAGANTLLLATNALGNPTTALINATTFTPQTGTQLKLTGSALATGTGIPLVSYGSLTGAGFAGLTISLPPRTNGTLVNNTGASRVDLDITSIEQAKWRGNVDGNWDADTDGSGSSGTANWRTTVVGTSTKYLQGSGGTDVANFDDSADGTHNVNLTATLTPLGVNVSGSSNYKFSGSGKISGGSSILKTGSGELTIANTAANDHTGGTSIGTGGKILLGDGVTSGAGVILGTISNNGTLVLNHPEDHSFATVVTGSGVLRKDQTNTVTVTPVTTLTGDVSLMAGKLNFSGGGALSGAVSGPGQLEVSGGNLQLGGTAANTNTGLTTVSAGTLQLNKPANVDAIGGNVLFNGTGALTLSAANQFADTATVSFDKAINGGSITLGNETLAAVNIINGHDTGAQVLGNNGLVVNGNVTIGGTGVFSIASAHTSTVGGVVLNGGILRVSGNSGNSMLNIGAGGITASAGEIQIKFNANAQDAVVNLGGNFTATGNVNITNAAYAGASLNVINLTADRVFDIASGTTTSVQPDFAGPGALTKTGNGTLALQSTSSAGQTGNTTIEAGTLSLTGSANIPNSPNITIKSGAVLDVSTLSSPFMLGGSQILHGKGTLTGSVITSAGTKFDMGESPGTLTFNGSLDITNAVAGSATGAFITDLTTPGASDMGLLTGANALTIGTAGLEFDDFAFTPLAGFGPGTYTLFDTSTPIVGTLGASLSGSIGGFSSTISLGDGGNDIVLSVIPEPGVASVLGMVGLGLLGRRRRSRNS